MATTPAPRTNFRKIRVQSFLSLHFRKLTEAQLFQKPAPLPVRYLHETFTKGLAITMLSHWYKITSLLNHIKLYNTPTIKNIAPQERCSPDYFHVLMWAECQHFCLMQCKSQKKSLTMKAACRQKFFPMYTCPHTHIT